MIVAPTWPSQPRKVSRIITGHSSRHETRTCLAGQVKWNAVTKKWRAGVGQRGRSFDTEEEAARHWSAKMRIRAAAVGPLCHHDGQHLPALLPSSKGYKRNHCAACVC
jgi:hypothetical protein